MRWFNSSIELYWNPLPNYPRILGKEFFKKKSTNCQVSQRKPQMSARQIDLSIPKRPERGVSNLWLLLQEVHEDWGVSMNNHPLTHTQRWLLCHRHVVNKEELPKMGSCEVSDYFWQVQLFVWIKKQEEKD